MKPKMVEYINTNTKLGCTSNTNQVTLSLFVQVIVLLKYHSARSYKKYESRAAKLGRSCNKSTRIFLI